MKFKSVIFLSVFAALAGCWKPYNTPEFVDIAPNETAFVIKLVGENNDDKGQVKIQSEAYLEQNRVAAKQVEITHRWIDTGYAAGDGKWIPDVIVIKVDRSAVTRVWTKAAETGTAAKNEAVEVESKDSVGFSVGFSCTAYIKDEDAARFLYNHPSGSLDKAMDAEILGHIQKDVQEAVNPYEIYEVPGHKGDIQKAVEVEVVAYAATRGITVANIAMLGGLEYDNPRIQEAIDQVAQANNLKSIAQAKFDAQQKENDRVDLEAKGLAQAAREKAEGEADAKLSIAQAEAKSIEAVQKAIGQATNPQMIVALRALEIQSTQAERWDGRYPQWYMMSGNNSPLPTLMVNAEPPSPSTQPAH